MDTFAVGDGAAIKGDDSVDDGVLDSGLDLDLDCDDDDVSFDDDDDDDDDALGDSSDDVCDDSVVIIDTHPSPRAATGLLDCDLKYCAICFDCVEGPGMPRCATCAHCGVRSHLPCLALSSLDQDVRAQPYQLLPTEAICPFCDARLPWKDLVRGL